MIAANYTAVFYCDCEQCKEYPVVMEYIGTSWTGVAKEARKDGWRISKDRTRCYYPNHKMGRYLVHYETTTKRITRR